MVLEEFQKGFEFIQAILKYSFICGFSLSASLELFSKIG